MRASRTQRGSAIFIAVVLGLLAAGCKQVDTLTGLFATRTPVPTLTPTPAPSAFLRGQLLFGAGDYSGLDGPATVFVFQAAQTLTGPSAIDGSYEITGLEPGAASVTVLGKAQGQTVTGAATLTLGLGENALNIQLAVQP